MGKAVSWGRRVLVLLAMALLAGGAGAKSAYFIQADVVRGAVGAMGAVCVANAIFMPTEEIVWRAYVYDAESGELLTQDQIDKLGIQVYGELDSGIKIPLHYVPHPPEQAKTELFWAAGWQIPADYATGSYVWSVTVEDSAGNTAKYLPMGSSVGLGTINIVKPETAAPPTGAAAPSTPDLVLVANTTPAADGEQVFTANCVACHQANGAGIPAAFPPLANNPIVAAEDPTFITRVVLFGLQGPITVEGADYNGLMPPWEKVLNDDQIAAVLTYIRSNFGNKAAAVDAATVGAQRAKAGTPEDNHAHYPK